MYHGKIRQTGSYVPNRVITNDDLSTWLDTSDEWIYTRTGIKRRHIADNESVSDMATKAVMELLKRGNISPLSIDMIVVATMSSDYATPSVACMVQGEIGADHAFAFDIQAACSGFVYGLEMIEQYIQSGKVKRAILVGAERLSRLLNWQDRSTCVLFGDGAAAVYIESTDEDGMGIVKSQSYSIGKSWESLKSPLGDAKTPWNDVSTTGYLSMDGGAVFQFACKKVPEAIRELLEGLPEKDQKIDYYVLHQANQRIVQRIAKNLKEPIEKFYMNLEEYGNTSGASIPLALDEMNKKGLLENKKVVFSGFGAGLTYGVSLVQF